MMDSLGFVVAVVVGNGGDDGIIVVGTIGVGLLGGLFQCGIRLLCYCGRTPDRVSKGSTCPASRAGDTAVGEGSDM